MSTDMLSGVLARRTVLHASNARGVQGRDLRPGDVLATGVILQVDNCDIDGEVRLEMPGANIHYVNHDDEVTVLATLDTTLLDAISVGTFIARASLRHTRPPLTDAGEVEEPTFEPADLNPGNARTHPAPSAKAQRAERRGSEKSNRGPLGQYEPHVEHYTDTCPVHGETKFAIHRVGQRPNGDTKFIRRCLACHSEYNLARYRARS